MKIFLEICKSFDYMGLHETNEVNEENWNKIKGKLADIYNCKQAMRAKTRDRARGGIIVGRNK